MTTIADVLPRSQEAFTEAKNDEASQKTPLFVIIAIAFGLIVTLVWGALLCCGALKLIGIL